MQPLARAFHELQLKLAFYEHRHSEFQNFFASIMEMRYPSDFYRVRPWGSKGDQKNDGYLKSTKQLFQVYAPDSMRANDAIKKIDEDYQGAFPYWKEYYTSWIFVHNAIRGLGPEIVKKLLDLDNKSPGPSVNHWGYPEIRLEAFGLSDDEIALVLGPVPTTNHIVGLRFEELRDVLLVIGDMDPPADIPIRPVPPDKLSSNRLSANSQILLTNGMAKAGLVGEFFANWWDPGLGDRVAQAFRDHYEALRDAGMQPDDIFERLYVMAGGEDQSSPKHQVAVLTVLAYFFEQCDIFEAMPAGLE
jgi:hypothetical protein